MKERNGIRRDLEKYYLVHQSEIDKIDALIGALNLAVSEILELRPVKSDLWRATPAQDDYDDQVGKIIYRDDPVDF